jgi:phosphoglycolate phosphatase-like HAD superfamily hydrolase
MTTLVFDIDGTLTDLWPLESAVLQVLTGTTEKALAPLRRRSQGNLYAMYLQQTGATTTKTQFRRLYRQAVLALEQARALPAVPSYRAAGFIRANKTKYRFVYLTGGLKCEALYALRSLGILGAFSEELSISSDSYPFSKATGLPLRKIQRAARGPMLVIADGSADKLGADKAGVPILLVEPNQAISTRQVTQSLKDV